MIEKTLEDSSGQLYSLEEEKVKISTAGDFDAIVFLTAMICKTPVAVLCMKNAEGNENLHVTGASEENIPFTHTLDLPFKKGGVLYSKDLVSELPGELPNFTDYSFFAGKLLISKEEENLGMLYVLDYEERLLTAEQKVALEILANQLIRLMEFKSQHTELKKVQLKLRQKYQDLEKFASVVSHDIKSPLANIISLTEFLKEENVDNLSEETVLYLDFLIQSSYSLRNYVDGILTFYRSDNILEREEENVDLNKLLQGIEQLYQVNPDVVISYPDSGFLQNVNKAALTQIFLNLISNALKYNSKKTREVEISFEQNEEYYLFEVRDNGNGIPQKDFDKIFELFSTLDVNDRDGHPGSGIGLATVKKMIDHMEGSMELKSAMGKGSIFKFKIKRK